MTLTMAQKNYLGGSLAVGVLGAIGFAIGAANASGGNQRAYIAASVVCGLIAVFCLIYMLAKK